MCTGATAAIGFWHICGVAAVGILQPPSNERERTTGQTLGHGDGADVSYGQLGGVGRPFTQHAIRTC